MPDPIDLTTLPLAELLTADEVMRKVVAAAEDENSMTCAFNSAI